MINVINKLVKFITKKDGIGSKEKLSNLVSKQFSLTKDRSVFYCNDFAIRFSTSASVNFSNTILSLSNLKKIDDRPFFVCLVTPEKNHLFLSNSTFLKKISHSSQELRANNIKGSFNGSDIMREFESPKIHNTSKNFYKLFKIHKAVGFEGNLPRLVAATTGISPSGSKFRPTKTQVENIKKAPTRALQFINSKEFWTLKKELDDRVCKFHNEILLASFIENINIRGRVIEYFISGKDDRTLQELTDYLKGELSKSPPLKAKNGLGDYSKDFMAFLTETDVKTKIMLLDSNPKAYNLDKMLEFLSKDRSVFLFYFIGINPGETVATVLASMFQDTLRGSTFLLKHWAGRNSRGVSQLEGKAIKNLILNSAIQKGINIQDSKLFLDTILSF